MNTPVPLNSAPPSAHITYDDLDLTTRDHLLASLPKSWDIAVEIGVWEARYMANMLMKTNMTVLGVDPYCSVPQYLDPEVITDIYERDSAGDHLISFTRYMVAQVNIRTTNLNLKVAGRFTSGQIFRAYGHEVLPYCPDETIDFIYIDGDHTYEAVAADIAGWWPKLKVGGILAGHDYNDQTPGTVQAVDEFSACLEKEKKFNPEFKITGTQPGHYDADAPSWVLIKEAIK
jgi:hypothetical protein